jgi:chitinase
MVTSLLLASLFIAPSPLDAFDLGCISDGNCYPSAINESGQVAGIGDAPNGSGQHSFFWSGSSLVHINPLTYPNGGYIWAYGINDYGSLVGYSSTGNGQFHTFHWDGEQIYDLGAPEWAVVNYSQAHDINNNGWIVGFAGGVPYDLRGFIKHDDVWEEIPTFGGTESKAYAINELNDVVGVAKNTDGKLRAYGIPTGNISLMTDLGDLGGGAAQARAVNNNRTIAGFSLVDDTYWHAFKWTFEYGMIDLGTFGGNESRAYAMNDAGHIVGQAEYPDGTLHGFVWMDGVMYDLNNFIVPDVAITITNAKGINNDGVISSIGEHPDGSFSTYLLSPMDDFIPEDVNSDGYVNVVDLLAVVGSWGECPDCPEDVNNDAVVDVQDVLAIISAWSN